MINFDNLAKTICILTFKFLFKIEMNGVI